MKASSISGKTIRPGSLNGFNYYYSGRYSGSAAKTKAAKVKKAPKRHFGARVYFALVILAAVAGLAAYGFNSKGHSPPGSTNQAVLGTSAQASSNHCNGNSLNQLIIVSISQRHIWACQAGKQLYDSPVITGMSAYASTVTPTGTYHINDKVSDTILRGSDETGSWVDPVKYWMPFLSNQYGVYGLHDATWRDNNQFGQIAPSSSNASHGCVELPTQTAAWIYNWAQVGTTLTIQA